MTTYILSIHQRTVGTWAVILDRKANVVASAFAEITQYFPQLGWVEHDAEEIWKVSLKVVAEALRNGRISPEQIDAIGRKDFASEAMNWASMKEHMYMIADALGAGIVKQFPKKF